MLGAAAMLGISRRGSSPFHLRARFVGPQQSTLGSVILLESIGNPDPSRQVSFIPLFWGVPRARQRAEPLVFLL